MTALMLAARAGHDDVVFLLPKGMQTQDIHHQTPQGDTALSLAAAAGHADVVNMLLTKGAQQAHKNAALTSAAAAGQIATVTLLLQQSAALAAGHTQAAQLLRSGDAPEPAYGIWHIVSVAAR